MILSNLYERHKAKKRKETAEPLEQQINNNIIYDI